MDIPVDVDMIIAELKSLFKDFPRLEDFGEEEVQQAEGLVQVVLHGRASENDLEAGSQLAAPLRGKGFHVLHSVALVQNHYSPIDSLHDVLIGQGQNSNVHTETAANVKR